MNHNSRTKNSVLNFVANTALQLVSIITAFIVRRVFIQNLGIEFLGIAGLFNNILAVLSLAEMGVGTAMTYSMYKAVANADKDKLAALNNFYRSVYNKIALFIVIVGLAFMPFLSFVVNLDRAVPHLHLYYLLEIINTAISYLFIYKTSIVNSDQSGYKLSRISIILQLFTSLLQIVSLFIFKKYMIYLLIGIGITFINNLIKSHFAEKWYPFIKDKSKILAKEEKDSIWANIKSMFLYKIGGVILNNTDNILISVIVNTVTVGIYSNYLMLYNKANAVINIAFSSVLASVGNFNALANKEEKYKLFKVVDFMAYILYSYFAIGVFFCGDDAIKAVTGTTSLLLSQSVLIVTIVYFYLNMLKRSVSIFRETTGLFKYGKYSFIISAILNIIFSIVLGKLYGVFGILIATIIARLLSDVWYEPFVLYNRIFNKKVLEYYREQIWRALIVVGIIFLIIPINRLISIENLYIRAFINGSISVLVTSLIFFIVFRKNENYLYLKEKAFLIVNKAKSKLIKND